MKTQTLLLLCCMTLTLTSSPARADHCDVPRDLFRSPDHILRLMELLIFSEAPMTDGPFARTRDDGRPKIQGEIRDQLPEGKWILTSDRGAKVFEGELHRGRVKGPWVFRDRDGNLCDEGYAD